MGDWFAWLTGYAGPRKPAITMLGNAEYPRLNMRLAATFDNKASFR